MRGIKAVDEGEDRLELLSDSLESCIFGTYQSRGINSVSVLFCF